MEAFEVLGVVQKQRSRCVGSISAAVLQAGSDKYMENCGKVAGDQFQRRQFTLHLRPAI